jgi:DNA repair protein RadD
VTDASLACFLDHLSEPCEELRDYQRQQISETCQAIRNGARRILDQAPTGAGKTHMFCAVTRAAERAGLRVLILATRTRLVRQIHERLLAFGVPHGVIAAPLPELAHNGRPVQVASVDTLYRRCIVDERAPLPTADVVIFDEAHLALAATRIAILEQYSQALVLGWTATPARRSGKPLREQFDVLITGLSVRELIQAGQLVRPRIFNIPVMSAQELDEIPKDTSRDYQASALGKLMSVPKLVGDVVQNWLEIAAGKRTLVFAISKAHGEALVEQFGRAGIAAELLTDADDEDTREAVVARLESGTTTILVNCFLMSYGVDVPTVECVVLARPTRSVVLFLQCVGRGLRPAPGKDFCLVIDHGRVVENLGVPTGDFGWTLEENSNVNDQAAATNQRADGQERARTCRECGHFWLVSEEGSRCSCCGWEPKPAARAVPVEAARLRELDTETVALSPHDPRFLQFFQEALGWYARRWPYRWQETPNKGRSYAWFAACEKFEMPEGTRIPSRFWGIHPAAVSGEVDGFMRYRYIRFSRRRA